jgi:hypothetical protein
MPDDRTYIRVHDGFDEHPKIEGLTDAAFRLLITTWCYSSRNGTDGRMTAKAWAKRGTPKARRELIAAGLIEVHDDHLQAHDYLEHQRSAAEIELYKSVKGNSGSYGNHVRWHVIKRTPKADCEYCQDDPSGDRSRIATAIAKPSQTVASTETETEVTTQERGELTSVGVASAMPPLPRRCPTHLDHPAPPPCGACKDARMAADAAGPGLRLVAPLNRCLIHDTSYDRVCNGCEADRKAAG